MIRSAAPGPAPMKCTVMASPPALASAQVPAPTTMRGQISRACRPAGGERRRLGDRRHAGQRRARARTAWRRAREAASRSRLGHTARRGRRAPPRPRAMPGLVALACGRRDEHRCAPAAEPARASAARRSPRRCPSAARPCGSRCRRRSWLHPQPLRHRHRRAPCRSCRRPLSAREMAMRVKLAAERGVARDQQRLGLQRHRIDDQPAAGLAAPRSPPRARRRRSRRRR